MPENENETAAPMSAEEARAVLDTADALLHSLKMDPDTKAIHIERFSRARTAVAAMAEREAALAMKLADCEVALAGSLRREDALIAENEALRGIADAAKVYFDGWAQDEADDEGIHWTGCSESQHKAARNLKLALAARTEPR